MRNEKSTIILLSMITLILLTANILIFLNKVAKPQRDNKEIEKEYLNIIGQQEMPEIKIKTQEERDKEELESVKSKTETERIRYYLGKYLSYVEEQKYEKAYNIMYPDFKDNYFQTQDSYEKYVKRLYPELIGVECNDISRQGEYYILSVTIVDPMGEEENIRQKFIIKENNYLDFVISFQVI